MDIHSGGTYPSSALSNFACHPFILDEVQIISFEGFLQSLKFKIPEVQASVCKLIGKMAKSRGRAKKWQRDQTLYWKGEPIKRDSEAYQLLLDRAYQAMFEQSESFRNALKASQGMTLTHSIGKNKINETVLTEREFCSRLIKLRNQIDKNE